jgi:hypothetical protein
MSTGYRDLYTNILRVGTTRIVQHIKIPFRPKRVGGKKGRGMFPSHKIMLHKH